MNELKRFISPRNLEEAFLEVSAGNTSQGIETCALICGAIKPDSIVVSHLVFPKQTGTTITVDMSDDVDVDLYLLETGLSVLGWIHSHPTQTAFLSSVDLHTQFGYQRLLPEAVAVVCAPRYGCNKWLRLTEQGMKLIADCSSRGFHEHVSKSKLFHLALDVMFNETSVQVIDMRQHCITVPAATDDSAEQDSRTPAQEVSPQPPDLSSAYHHSKTAATARQTDTGQHNNRSAAATEQHIAHPGAPADQATPATDFSISKLRRVAVKIEKNKSHKEFLETCQKERVVPRGFQLKWECHFDMNSEEVASILDRASHDLVSASINLAKEKVSKLEQEYDVLLQMTHDYQEEQTERISSIIAHDVNKTRAVLAKTKNKKLQNLCTRRTRTQVGTSEEEPISAPVEVVNRSSRVLSAEEQSVLSKGLSFVPSKRQTVAHLTAELKEWERLMRLREYWHGVETQRDVNRDSDNKYRSTKWVPPRGRDPWLDLYLEEVTASIIQDNKRKVNGNLSRAEEEALRSLVGDESIIIRPADKGSGIVIMDTKDYLQGLEQEISDSTTYQKTTEDQTAAIQKKVKKLVSALHQKGYIGPHQRSYMLPTRPQPGQLQGNPKLHKPGAPLRTIVNGRGHPTERIAEAAEEQLRLHVESQPSYVRDTTDFLRKLKDTSQPILGDGNLSPVLFCMDVRKLYPSVPRAEGIEACQLALDDRPNPQIPTQQVIEMIELVLDSNNFTLTPDNHYIQSDGTAIGSRLGKNYACTYMGQWEKQLLSNAPFKPMIYWRYIDDIFGIWLHGEQELVRFHERANQIHPKIQVDLRTSHSQIEFLLCDILTSRRIMFIYLSSPSFVSIYHVMVQYSLISEESACDM